MPANRFIPLYSTQSGAVPTASALYQGELAINIADGRLFTRSGSAIVLLNSRVSSSYAQTSSYALNAGSGVGFPFSGAAVITGSLLVEPSGSIGGITGSLFGTASFATTALTASYVPGAASDWNSVANKPANLVSSSAQVQAFLPDGTVSSSGQVSITSTNGYSTFSSSIATKNDIQDVSINALNAATSSYAINATIQSQLVGVASSSTQVKAYLPDGTVSSSGQVDITATTGYSTFSSSLATVDAGQTTRIDNLASLTSSYAINSTIQGQLAGVVSSSAQVQPLLPGGTVSSSGQVDITTTTGYSTFSSSIATKNDTQDVSIGALNAATSSYAIDATIQGQLAGVVSSSTQVKPLLPGDTVSSSAQVKTFLPADTVSSSAQYPGWVTASSQIALSGVTGTTFATANFTFPQNLTVGGTLTAQEIQTEYVTSSIIYESGSTKFGDTADDTHQFTGSLSVLGTISGGLVLPSGVVTASSQIDYNSITNKLSGVISSSTQFNALSDTSASFATTASAATSITFTPATASFATTASFALNAQNVPAGTVSSSAQYPGWVTSSTQIVWSSVNYNAGIVSSSTQVKPLLPGGTVTASAQIPALLPGGTVSSSAQYPGWVTGSAQIVVQNTTGIGALATTGSNTFVGNQVISGSLTTTADTMTFNGSMAVSGALSLTGSLNVLNGGFTGSLTGSATTAISASYATTASYALNAGAGAGFPFSGSAVITGSLELIDTANKGGITGSLLGTSSWAANASNAITASYAINADTAIGINVDNHSFIGDGVTTNYTLSQSYALISLNVSADGLTLTPTVDYSIAGTTLSLVSAPPSESNIFVKAWSNATQNVNGSFTGSFIGTLNGDMTGSAKFTTLPNIAIKGDTHLFIGDGATTAYTLSSSYDDSVVFVSVDGMTQALIADFSISGTTLNLVTTPPSASNVVVKAVRLIIS